MSCESLMMQCFPLVPLSRYSIQLEQKLKKQPQDSHKKALKPPKKVERRKEKLSERRKVKEAARSSRENGLQSQVDDSIQEQLSIGGGSREDSIREQLTIGAPSEVSEASTIASVISKQNSTSSVAEVVSDEASETATSQVRTQLSLSAETTSSKIPSEYSQQKTTGSRSKISTDTGSKIPSEYTQETFEDNTLTPASPGPSHQGVVATSTPIPVPGGGTADGPNDPLLPVDYTLSESLRLSESLSGKNKSFGREEGWETVYCM